MAVDHFTYVGETGRDSYIARCTLCGWKSRPSRDEHTAQQEADQHYLHNG